MERLTADDVAALRRRPARSRLRVAITLAGTTYGEVARAVGLSRAHVASAAQGSQRLSVVMKIRIGRVLGVPPAVVWPELETMALELMHGARRGK